MIELVEVLVRRPSDCTWVWTWVTKAEALLISPPPPGYQIGR